MRQTTRDLGPAFTAVRALAVRAAAFSPANNTGTPVPLDTALHDPMGMLMLDGRLVVPYRGLYDLHVNWAFAANATGQRRADILINGSFSNIPTFNGAPNGTQFSALSGSVFNWKLNAGDAIGLSVVQDSGGALALTVSATQPLNAIGLRLAKLL